jgi:isopenicillin N synthase-like dioxygenase
VSTGASQKTVVLTINSTLSDHGISPSEVKAAFDLSARFFALDDDIKARTPLNGKNAGWEKNAQIRPSTGTADQKESMQLQFARMDGLWPDEHEMPDFKREAEYFMKQVQG